MDRDEAAHYKLYPVEDLICGDAFEEMPRLAANSFDLLFADPPYNLSKKFGKETFRQTSVVAYEEWLDSWLRLCVPLLKNTASVYVCGDWRSSSAIERVVHALQVTAHTDLGG